MSKLGPLGQSVAALFQAPSKAKGQETASSAQAGTGSVRVPGGLKGTVAGQQPQDSLGNPNSPGYESWGKKKKGEAAPAAKDSDEPVANTQTVIDTPFEGADRIRLTVGWEKLLLAQKKICEKAKGLFVKLDGNGNYEEQRRGKLRFLKNRGCILDVDTQETEEKQKARGALIDTPDDPNAPPTQPTKKISA